MNLERPKRGETGESEGQTVGDRQRAPDVAESMKASAEDLLDRAQTRMRWLEKVAKDCRLTLTMVEDATKKAAAAVNAADATAAPSSAGPKEVKSPASDATCAEKDAAAEEASIRRFLGEADRLLAKVEFFETLLNQRFNFFMMVYAFVVVGTFQVIDSLAKLSALVVLGAGICFLLAMTLWRAQHKVDIVIGKLHKVDPLSKDVDESAANAPELGSCGTEAKCRPPGQCRSCRAKAKELIGRGPKKLIRWGAKESRRKIVGYWLPLICTFSLILGDFAASLHESGAGAGVACSSEATRWRRTWGWDGSTERAVTLS